MTETKKEKLHRSAVLAFMAIVTTCLLALAFGQPAHHAAGLPGVVVYAFAAGFGLEYLGSAWTGRQHRSDHGQQLQS